MLNMRPLNKVQAPIVKAARNALRVLLISHTCQSRTEGQPKAEYLGRFKDIDLRVLTPQRWRHYGKWREADRPRESNFSLEVGEVSLPWAAPAQSYLHWYPHLGRLLKEFRPDVIDLWEEPWGLVSAHACWLKSQLIDSARIVIETEQNIAKALPPPFKWFRSYTLGMADFAIARSEEALQVLQTSGYRGPAEVVPNAVDAELFRPLSLERRDASRRALGLANFVVGYVGRLVAEKGILDAVDALALCPPDVCLLVVGDGSSRNAVIKRAVERKVEGRLHLVGAKQFDELPALIGSMDVLILPSRTTARWKEQFGRVVIEAHSCGVPVIGSDSGSIPNVLGKGGLIFPEGNAEALAEAISAMRADSHWSSQLGLIGREQVEMNYTWQRVAERMRDIYLRVAC